MSRFHAEVQEDSMTGWTASEPIYYPTFDAALSAVVNRTDGGNLAITKHETKGYYLVRFR